MDQIALDKERELVDVFLRELNHAHPKATSGEVMVRVALEQGAVDTLLLSEGLRKVRAHYCCRICGHEWQKTVERNARKPSCPDCTTDSSKVDFDKELSLDLIDELTQLATHTSSKVELISTDTEEGTILMDGFGGFAAILRYPWT